MHWKSTTARSAIKSQIITQNLLPYKCEICNISEWNGHRLSLHLDHKDGNNTHNNLKNLRFLCPNCHSQTHTYCGKNNKQKYSKQNPKVSDEELLDAMNKCKDVKSVLEYVGLSGAGNYKRIYRLSKIHGLHSFSSKDDKIAKKILELKAANIDTTKWGWIQKASLVLEISPQKTRKWIDRNYPEYYNN